MTFKNLFYKMSDTATEERITKLEQLFNCRCTPVIITELKV